MVQSCCLRPCPHANSMQNYLVNENNQQQLSSSTVYFKLISARKVRLHINNNNSCNIYFSFSFFSAKCKSDNTWSEMPVSTDSRKSLWRER